MKTTYHDIEKLAVAKARGLYDSRADFCEHLTPNDVEGCVYKGILRLMVDGKLTIEEIANDKGKTLSMAASLEMQREAARQFERLWKAIYAEEEI